MSEQQNPLEETPTRKGGAPKGNQNARKHGFYSTALTPEEQQAIQIAIELRGLQPEIALLRVKLMEIISHPGTSHELMLRAVRALTRMVAVQDHITHG